MIKNERQYRITRAQAQRFAAALERFDPTLPPGVHPRLHQAERDALKSQLDELHDELAAYEALRSGRRRTFRLESIEDLAQVLIAARIAAGLSQRDLAHRLGVAEQQVQRDEATEYASASLSRVTEIARALQVRVRPTVVRVGRGGS